MKTFALKWRQLTWIESSSFCSVDRLAKAGAFVYATAKRDASILQLPMFGRDFSIAAICEPQGYPNAA